MLFFLLSVVSTDQRCNQNEDAFVYLILLWNIRKMISIIYADNGLYLWGDHLKGLTAFNLNHFAIIPQQIPFNCTSFSVKW